MDVDNLKKPKIIPIPRHQVENDQSQFNEKHILISIAAPLATPIHIPDNENRIGILRAYFNDLDKELENMEGMILFNKDHAKNIIAFVNKYKNTVDTIYINCTAGISRSPAIAAALSKMIYGDDAYYFKKYTPNMLVYRIMMDEINGT